MELQNWLLPLCMLLFSQNSFVFGLCPSEKSLYLIKSTAGRLVLESRDEQISLQHFDGYTPQLWKFEIGDRPGLFYIINSASGKVLDVASDGKAVTVSEKQNSLKQQWYLNSNGRIFNPAHQKNLDVEAARYVTGNRLIVWSDNANAAQEFTISEKRQCCPSTCTNSTSFTLLTKQD